MEPSKNFKYVLFTLNEQGMLSPTLASLFRPPLNPAQTLHFFKTETLQQCVELAPKKGIAICHNGYPDNDGECWTIREGSRVEGPKL
jgi:hypothetical protein